MHCPRCNKGYPIVFGIPDFICDPDEQMRAKKLIRCFERSNFFAERWDIPPRVAEQIFSGPRVTFQNVLGRILAEECYEAFYK